MELLRGACGGSKPRWQVLLLLIFFFNVVAQLQFSDSARESPVIFQFGPMPSAPGQYTVQVPDSANVSQIESSMITCSESFVAGNNSLVLDTGANQNGICLYDKPVQLTRSVYPPTISTSFSTRFWLGVGNATNSTQMSFIITNDTSGQQAESFFAVNLLVVQDAQFALSFWRAFVTVSGSSVKEDFVTVADSYGSGFGSRASFDVWIQYDHQRLQVYIINGSDIFFDKPTVGMNLSIDLGALSQPMYVGFSGNSSTSGPTYISGWTFNSDGPAPDFLRDSEGRVRDLDAEKSRAEARRRQQIILITCITIPSGMILILLVVVILVLYKRNARLTALAEKYEIEEGLLDQGPRTYKYKVLSAATKGFSSNALLGSGGFGSVYRGRLWLKGAEKPAEIAVKRISATSHQGAREFLAEVKIIGQVQHRNLVRLLGWCHEKGELLLVYDFMPNGSVDQHLFKDTDVSGEVVLTWSRRLRIGSGIATALTYLHEEWDQRVIHRDVKSSNVMLDRDFNARLGDFGLARLSAHDQAPPSTAVLAGTYGYLAPEMVHTLKATEKTDVYSFGAMVLEVATGKRAILSYQDQQASNYVLLVDWVWSLYRNDRLLEAADGRLQGAFDPGEMIMFLKIGLLCSHPDPNERPSMREVVIIWKGSTPFPSLPRTKPVPTFIPCIDVYETELDTGEYGHVPT